MPSEPSLFPPGFPWYVTAQIPEGPNATPRAGEGSPQAREEILDVTAQLAAFAAELAHDHLPDEVGTGRGCSSSTALASCSARWRSRNGTGDRCLDRYLELAGPPGAGTVAGSRLKTTPMMAAFANGTLSEVLDCQDTNITARIHNGAAIIPAALAMGEVLASSGRDVMAAVVAGYEVGCRLGLATQPEHWYSGFQITGTFNTCGAAATAAG